MKIVFDWEGFYVLLRKTNIFYIKYSKNVIVCRIKSTRCPINNDIPMR